MRVATLAAAVLAGLLLAGNLLAHAVVLPGEAAVGAFQKYVLRVPNERDVPTTRVTLSVPEGVRVISFADVPGWTIETEAGPGGAPVSVTWSGELPVGRFVELPFMAVNPDRPGRLQWNVTQRYAGGEEIAWAGPEDSNTPASFTDIEAVDEAPVTAAVATEEESGGDVGPGTRELILAALALLVSVGILGLAMRPKG